MAGASRRHSHVIEHEGFSAVDHFEYVHSQIDVLLRSSKGLLTLVKKRISAEKDRIKALNKLTSFILEDTKTVTLHGVLGDSWRQIQLHSQQESLHRSKALSSIEEQVVQPLSVFLLSDLEKRFQTITLEVRRAVKEYHQQHILLQKCKDRYFTTCSEWENHLLLMYKEYGAAWEPVAGNKLYEKEQLFSKRVDEARSEYSSNVDLVNSLQQELCLHQLPQALSNIGETAEQMVSVIHSALKSFEILQASLIGKVDTEQSKACTEFFIVTEYCELNLFNSMDPKKLPNPQPVDFTEYSYHDSALQIQARKTQYRAMSLLSPAELATRGAMFLSEGGKGNCKVGGSPLQQPKMTALNKTLVDTCVEYLNQPLAKKEEGIFRVSGDSSIIKSLHSQFMTHDQDTEQVITNIKSQMDPNNVSGLLKLHLRENHILSSQVVAAVKEELKSVSERELSAVVEILITQCSSLELDLITKIVDLMKAIVAEPWKGYNKMTPRTLGIACGLSLFPQLDPGQATQLLEYLIKHSEELSTTHSIL